MIKSTYSINVDREEDSMIECVDFIKNIAEELGRGKMSGSGWSVSVEEKEAPDCDTCNGTGEIPTLVETYPGEFGNLANTDSRPCPDCQVSYSAENDD